MKNKIIKKIVSLVLSTILIFYFILTLNLNLNFQKNNYYAKAATSSVPAQVDPEISQFIENGADEFINYYKDQAQSRLSNKDPYVLYDIQINTNNLLDYAALTQNVKLLDQMGSLYLSTYQYMVMQDGSLKWLCGGPACPVWSEVDTRSNNKEVVLVSSQYVYLLSDYIDIVANIESNQRTATMKEMVTKFSSVVSGHLNRWALGSGSDKIWMAWSGCTTGANAKYRNILYNHQELLNKKLIRAVELGSGYSYCAAVTDSDLWVIATSAKLLKANLKDRSLVGLDNNFSNSLLNYLKIGSLLVESRTEMKNITDPTLGTIPTTNFDLGSWDDYTDYTYSGYTNATFPGISESQLTALPKKPGVNVGWDLSHGRRFVNTFDALYLSKSMLETNFPSDQVMQGLANQLLKKSFNQDNSNPLFSNYLDGTNGWYRVNYSGRSGFGYAPSSLSSSVLTGGYGFWSRYNTDINNVLYDIWQKIKITMILDTSGNQNLGLNNGVSFGAGKNNNGVAFDGLNAFIEPTQKKPLKTSKATLSFYFKPDNNSDMNLVNFFQDSYENFLLVGKNDKNQIYVYSEKNNVSKISLTSSTINNMNEWHHVAITQDGTGVKIYLDGKLDTGVIGTNANGWTEDLTLNGAWVGKGHWSGYKGQLDEFKFYDKALNDQEISRDFSGQVTNANNLKLNWQFDQNPDQDVNSFIKKYYAFDSGSLMNFLPTIALNLSIKDEVVITPEKKFIYPGGTLRYNIRYQNNSGGTITNFKFENAIPSGAVYVENSATNSGKFENGKMVWLKDSILDKQSFVAAFSVRIL